MNFAQRFKEVRQTKNLTQTEVANRLNVSRSIISLWESGNRIPPVTFMKEIANVLGVSVNYLIGDTADALTYDESMNEVAKAIVERPELKMLFNEAITSKREDIIMVTTLLERLK